MEKQIANSPQALQSSDGSSTLLYYTLTLFSCPLVSTLTMNVSLSSSILRRGQITGYRPTPPPCYRWCVTRSLPIENRSVQWWYIAGMVNFYCRSVGVN